MGIAGLVGLSGTAGAHGPTGHGGEPIAFAVVVGLPIVAGLGGGTAFQRLRTGRTTPDGHRVGVAIGLSLAVLGVTFAISAVGTSRTLGLAGGVAGAVSVLWATRRAGGDRRGCHADLALGAVSAHRVVEGVAIGALYSAGATIGVLGAVLLAGHAALETAAVCGSYATGPYRSRAFVAILLVQAGYAGGAIVGLGLADVLPATVRALALAVAGGALLVVGARETERSIGTGRTTTIAAYRDRR